MPTQIQFRRALSSTYTILNPILSSGEPGLEIDTNKIKYGDGTSSWNDLPYAGSGGINNWDNTKNYELNDIVIYNDKIWQTIVANSDSAPDPSNINWKEISGSTPLPSGSENHVLTYSSGNWVSAPIPVELPSGSQNNILVYSSGNWTSSANISIDNLDTNKRYTEKLTSLSISSNILNIDLSLSNLFTCLLNSQIDTININNTPSAANTVIGFTLIFTADGTSRSVAWPNSIKWAGNFPPVLTTTNNKQDVLSFVSVDNGTSWLGFVGGQNY